MLVQDINKKADPIELNFKAKFFPESVNDELLDTVVQRYVRDAAAISDTPCYPRCVTTATALQRLLAGGLQIDGRRSVHPLLELNFGLRIFWKQIKAGIVDDTIYCPPELCVLFAAQSMQALNGDFNADAHGPGTVIPSNELPQRCAVESASASSIHPVAACAVLL